jgi:hypothetical protein
MQKSFEHMAIRSINAENNFLDQLMHFGGITREQAETVFSVYKKAKFLNLKEVYSMGRIRVKHGAFLDRDFILNALSHAG